jgi:thiol-disulfide isomerase/thioredoxin
MMRRAVSLIAFCLAGTALTFPQAATPHSDALDLLNRVAQHYADAKSYDIELTEEDTSTRKFYRHWSKTVLIAAEAPGNRSHFEGHTSEGRSLQVSDGKTIWDYRVDERRYTAKPWSAPDPAHLGPIAMSELGPTRARQLRAELQSAVKRLNSAEFLPDEDMTVGGKVIHCKVVHIRDTDEKRVDPNFRFDKRIWIDPDRLTILKTTEHRNSFLIAGTARLPLEDDVTVTYTKTVIDDTLPDDLFAFQAPSDAHEIAEFPNAMESFGLSSMAGDPIPPLKLKAADGSVKPIESFRGKPVLIDFWATWCAPCVASMPHLAEIYKEAKSKGLVLISVDQDEDAAKATDFMAKHGYEWPNYHDGDGAIGKLMGPSGIPRVVLVDANGQVVFDGSGDEDQLRRHVAKLGPEYADLAPKPKVPPCAVALQSK